MARLLPTALACSFLSLACASDGSGDSAGDTDTSDTSDTSDTTASTANTGGSTNPTATGNSDSDGDGTTSASETGETTADTAVDTTAGTAESTGGGGESGNTTGGDVPNGGSCTADGECQSLNCYVVPFLGGQCGECNEDADCANGGCTAPNPFENNGSVCNMGEAGGGCESSDVCMEGLSCGTVLDLLGLIQINTCGECSIDADCNNQLCAPIVSVQEFTGQNECIDPMSLPQDSYCVLDGNGDQACQSGICSTIDIMGLAEIGACGECNTDADCVGNATCQAGEFILDNGALVGSTCV